MDLKSKKTIISLVVLLMLTVSIPLGLSLVKTKQIFAPRAAPAKLIEVGDGPCVVIRNSKTTLTCRDVPLKLNFPFVFKSPTPTPTPTPTSTPVSSASPTPTVSPSPGTTASPSPGQPRSVSVRSFNNDINAAVESIRDTGGSVYVPQGTYALTQNISLSSNMTLFGDGDSTVININAVDNGITNKNPSETPDTNIVIRDLKIVGAGGSSAGGCCYGIRFRNIKDSYIINTSVENFSLDGITLYYKHISGVPKGVTNTRVTGCKVKRNGRQQISIIHGENNVIDSCVVDGSGSNGNWSGIDLEPEAGGDTWANGNRILNNNVSNSNVGITLLGVGGESGSVNAVKNNIVCRNTVSVPSVKYANGGKDNYFIGNQGGDVDTRAGANTLTSPDSVCDIPAALATLPAAPSKTNFSARQPEVSHSNFQNNTDSIEPAAVTKPGLFESSWTRIKNFFKSLFGFGTMSFFDKSIGRVYAQAQTPVVLKGKLQKFSGNNPPTEVTFLGVASNCVSGKPTVLLSWSAKNATNFSIFRGAETNPVITTTANGNNQNDPTLTITHKGISAPYTLKASNQDSETWVVLDNNPLPLSNCTLEAPLAQECTDSIDNDRDQKIDGADPQCHDDGKAENPKSFNSTIPYESLSFRLSDSEAGLTSAKWQNYNTDGFLNLTYTLPDSTLGSKEIWVEYRDNYGTKTKDSVKIELADKDPVIDGLVCNLDLTKQNVKVSVTGQRFGLNQGKLSSGNEQLDILDWQNDQATGIFKRFGTNPDQSQKFSIKVTRVDGQSSAEFPCQLNSSIISVGAKLICRDEGKFDVSNVKVSIIDDQGKKVDETVTIDKDGVVQGLKTKLQSGKQYAISIKAPNSLRRNASFVASEGTTAISTDKGDSFILPIGDIAPTNALDGKINSLDQSELMRQWKILGGASSKTLTGDFNRDGRVNSLDWACMRFDFNQEDDPILSGPDSVNGGSGSGSTQPGDKPQLFFPGDGSSTDNSGQSSFDSNQPQLSF